MLSQKKKKKKMARNRDRKGENTKKKVGANTQFPRNKKKTYNKNNIVTSGKKADALLFP